MTTNNTNAPSNALDVHREIPQGSKRLFAIPIATFAGGILNNVDGLFSNPTPWIYLVTAMLLCGITNRVAAAKTKPLSWPKAITLGFAISMMALLITVVSVHLLGTAGR